jgi:hypothetical protein
MSGGGGGEGGVSVTPPQRDHFCAFAKNALGTSLEMAHAHCGGVDTVKIRLPLPASVTHPIHACVMDLPEPRVAGVVRVDANGEIAGTSKLFESVDLVTGSDDDYGRPTFRSNWGWRFQERKSGGWDLIIEGSPVKIMTGQNWILTGPVPLRGLVWKALRPFAAAFASRFAEWWPSDGESLTEVGAARRCRHVKAWTEWARRVLWQALKTARLMRIDVAFHLEAGEKETAIRYLETVIAQGGVKVGSVKARFRSSYATTIVAGPSKRNATNPSPKSKSRAWEVVIYLKGLEVAVATHSPRQYIPDLETGLIVPIAQAAQGVIRVESRYYPNYFNSEMKPLALWSKRYVAALMQASMDRLELPGLVRSAAPRVRMGRHTERVVVGNMVREIEEISCKIHGECYEGLAPADQLALLELIYKNLNTLKRTVEKPLHPTLQQDLIVTDLLDAKDRMMIAAWRAHDEPTLWLATVGFSKSHQRRVRKRIKERALASGMGLIDIGLPAPENLVVAKLPEIVIRPATYPCSWRDLLAA